MEQGNKFHFKKILQFIIKEETSLKSLGSFFKSMEDFDRKSISTINQFTKEIHQTSSKLSNKTLIKYLNTFSIHQTQKNHSEQNLALFNEKINYWFQNCLQKLKNLQDKAKRMQSTKQNLTSKEIDSFKAELTEEMLQVNRLKQSLLNLYCHSILKNNSMQIEQITSKMQLQLQKSKPSNIQK